MLYRCCGFDKMIDDIQHSKKVVIFGSGVVGQITTPEILKQYKALQYVDCYIDNDKSKWGKYIWISGNKVRINSPQYLNQCSSNTIILINISRYAEVKEQLEHMECTKDMIAYIMPMMCIHNMCSEASKGVAIKVEKPLIPKKIHYMWLGGKNIPNNLCKCIDSWKKYCSDYEIIQWNENNYDVSKHIYMKQAYENGAYGFVPDYARLDILYRHGGFYLDTDVELIKSIEQLRYQEAFCGVEKWQVLNFGGCSGAVKGHPFIKKFLEERESIQFIDQKGNQNRNTCGFYDTSVALREGYALNGNTQHICGMNIYAYDYFHPYDYMSGSVNITENTYAIHHFNGGWLDDKMKEQNRITSQLYFDLYNECII